MVRLLVSLWVCLWALSPAFAATDAKEVARVKAAKAALKTSMAVVGNTPGDYTFTDSQGRSVRIADYRGKPVILSFVYSSCAQSCPVIIETLADAVAGARNALGADAFQVLTLGFDAPRDTPTAMTLFARRHGLDGDSWRFLSGDLEAVHGLTRDAGFTFFRSPKGFDHLDQVTILDGHGRIYRQVYGANFEMPLLVEPLKELVYGTPSPWSSPTELWKKIKLFCTIYDPAADRYQFDYSLFFKLFVGFTIISLMIGFVVRNMVRLRRREKNARLTQAH